MRGWMHEMNRRTITKRIVQAVAVAFGLLGLLWVFGGLLFTVPAIMESDRSVLFDIPLLLVVGGILLAIAWQNLRRFGPNAIKNVTCLVALTLWGILTSFDRSLESATADSRTALVRMAFFHIPLLVAIIFYVVVSKKLIRITETENIQPDAGLDAEDGVG
jgi:hypothetical protein